MDDIDEEQFSLLFESLFNEERLTMERIENDYYDLIYRSEDPSNGNTMYVLKQKKILKLLSLKNPPAWSP